MISHDAAYYDGRLPSVIMMMNGGHIEKFGFIDALLCCVLAAAAANLGRPYIADLSLSDRRSVVNPFRWRD